MKIKQQDGSQSELTKKIVKKARKPKAVKEPKDIRYVFRKTLRGVDLDKLKKPWMAQKAFRLITTPDDLQEWVDSILSDTTRHVELNGVLTPVIALDTETTGLDTRILVDRVLKDDGSWELTYEVNVELAGICLSSDGIDGIYIPTTHEKQDQDLLIPATNIDRQKCAEILQYLFDRSHLVFYNAKFDREILRLTMGINFRPYPYFEDVQVLAYINDPKADLGDKGGFSGSAGGLKALSENVLGIEQIKLEDLAKVRCDYCPITGGPFCKCTEEQRKENKHSLKNQFVPFPWIPTDLALWYAAADAICTWLLWEKMYKLARTRRLVHRIDHELVESITWIERQRWFVDTDRLARTVKGHAKKIGEMREELRELALKAGFEETKQEDGTVLEDDKFNPGSPLQLQSLFFKIKGYTVTRFTSTGNPSCDAEALEDLYKEHPDDVFLKTLLQYRDYVALHPDSLKFDPRDNSARIYLKQNVVAGGRLSAAGGDFEKDGGFGLNPQGIKKVESQLMWKIRGNVLVPDPEEIDDKGIEVYSEEDLHPSCFKEVETIETIVTQKQKTDWDSGEGLFSEVGGEPLMEDIVEEHKVKVRKKAPGIIHNHIGKYMGYAICLVPTCTSCADKYGVLIPDTKMDANEVINLRVLFKAPPGYTMFSVDYCMAPNTRVLTSDLQWKPVGVIKEGEELIGFDEHLPNKKWGRRSLHPSIVEHVERLQLPCVEVTTDKGVVTCYESHKWLARVRTYGDKKHRGQYDWVESTSLKIGQEIAYLCDPWEEDKSYEAGYLKSWDGLPCQSKHSISAKVLSIKPVGIQEVVAVRTSTHTFIAEGLLSHNCNIEMRCAANCLAGETKVLIKDKGFVPISDNLGKATLLNSRKEWVDSEIRSFGIQPLRRVVIGHNKVNTLIYATPNHRWVLADGSEKFTDQLENGDEIPSINSADGYAGLTESDFLLPHKKKGFRNNQFELHETVRRVELTDRVEEVFCAIVPDTHDFVIENGLLTGNCSGEPEFINEFLIGKGDFHSLTASKVFPEFTDPTTSKDIRKALRSLAKIINFALLYGGTEYTIFENMKKSKPDITWKEAKEMVARYWEGVPQFFDFCQRKQNIAKEEMLCKTATGRVINFESAMTALHIHKPSDAEMQNYWEYRSLMKNSEEAKKEGDLELSAKYKSKADVMWKDLETGVRNAMDYNKFMGKIQRVSVNVPLQGLAGDFMRMAINRIRKWVESDPLIQSVFHLHCSVHDEIDFIVKNEYVPFVLPRVTRLMKLRKLHEKMNWTVPIESDAEYGTTWDVDCHVTGDEDHTPAAWTEIKEVANYIPEGWDVDTLKNLIRSVSTEEESRIEKVRRFLEENLHPRAFIAANHFFTAKDNKERKKALIAALQLDEFWRTDNVPDDEDDKLESFADYELRNELGPENRDPLTPEFGYLGAIPLTATIKRPTLEILGDVVSNDVVVSTVLENEPSYKEEKVEVLGLEEKLVQALDVVDDIKNEIDTTSQTEDSVFSDMPIIHKKKVVEETAPSMPTPSVIEDVIPADGKPTYELIDLDDSSLVSLRAKLGTGIHDIRILYCGKLAYLRNKNTDSIPDQFIKAIHGV
jgi:DNA polymerase I-like protein with 3'-5' exonuclease and polymerase domains